MSAAYLFAALGGDDSPSASRDRTRIQREDAALVARLRDGDESALEAIYKMYHAMMWDVAHRYVHDRDLAEDVTHDVFDMFWERRATLTVDGALSAYLLGAVRHRALNVLRHTGVMRRAAEAFDGDDVPALGTAPPRPDTVADMHDVEARVLRYVDALPERTRTLVMLRWKHGLSYGEIASALGMSQEAAKKLGQRVQGVLRPLVEALRAE